MGMTYHPQTDGESEQMNQELNAYLRIFCLNNPGTWKHYLMTAEFAYSNKKHSVTRTIPLYLMMVLSPNHSAKLKRIVKLQRVQGKAMAV
jgi:hypothetical protein